MSESKMIDAGQWCEHGRFRLDCYRCQRARAEAAESRLRTLESERDQARAERDAAREMADLAEKMIQARHDYDSFECAHLPESYCHCGKTQIELLTKCDETENAYLKYKAALTASQGEK